MGKIIKKNTDHCRFYTYRDTIGTVFVRGFILMKKISLSVWKINNTDFKIQEPVLYTVTYNLVEYNFIVSYREKSSKIFIIQHRNQEEYTKASADPGSPLWEILDSGDFSIIHYFNPVIYNDKTDKVNLSPVLPERCLKTLTDIINIIIARTDNSFSVKYCYGTADTAFNSISVAEKLGGAACLYYSGADFNDKKRVSLTRKFIDEGYCENNEKEQLRKSLEGLADMPAVIFNTDIGCESFITKSLVPALKRTLGNKFRDDRMVIRVLQKPGISATDIELSEGLRVLADGTASGAKKTINYPKLYRKRLDTFYANYDPEKVLEINNYFRGDKEVVACANEIIHGKMIVHKILVECPYESIDTFDWNVQIGNNPDTYQNYLQSLTPCYAMIRAYELTKKNYYIKYALDVFNSWYGYACKPESVSRNRFMWKDHPAALRAEILSKLLYTLQEHKYFRVTYAYRIIDVLYATVFWLSDSDNYYFNHNHGIMQDRALLELGHFFNQTKALKIAVSRLIKQLKNAFNSEYIHTENSAQYAYMVTRMFRNISGYLKAINDKRARVFEKKINKIDEYLSWLVMPNRYLIQTGDSPYIIPRRKVKERKDSHKIYPKSGIYFYRGRKVKHPVDRTYKFFKCGCSSRVHKHADDLSFILYSKGKEIFVDSGFPGYEVDDCRRYYVSSRAHNTLLVDNAGYYFDDKLPENLSFKDYHLGDDFDYVNAESRAYKGVTINRRFISIDDFTFIKDNLVSLLPHTYSQLFHLGEGIELVEYDDYGFVAKINDDYFVKLVQFNRNTKISIYSNLSTEDNATASKTATAGGTAEEKKGESSNKKLLFGYGYRALNIGEFRNICTVKFDIKRKMKAEFKTGIFIISRDNRIRMFDKENDFDLSAVKFKNDRIVIGESVFRFATESGKKAGMNKLLGLFKKILPEK